jgi:hypothetical protein
MKIDITGIANNIYSIRNHFIKPSLTVFNIFVNTPSLCAEIVQTIELHSASLIAISAWLRSQNHKIRGRGVRIGYWRTLMGSENSPRYCKMAPSSLTAACPL